MSSSLRDDSWVWVIIQEPDKDPQYLGQHDTERDIAYVPVFMEKDHALQCMNLFERDKSMKYEVQAVFYGELAKDARQNGFLLFILDGEGKLLEWVQPE